MAVVLDTAGGALMRRLRPGFAAGRRTAANRRKIQNNYKYLS